MQGGIDQQDDRPAGADRDDVPGNRDVSGRADHVGADANGRVLIPDARERLLGDPDLDLQGARRRGDLDGERNAAVGFRWEW